MLPEIIKDSDTYKRVLAEIDSLMCLDPDPASSDGKRLELFAHLAEDYENEHYAVPITDPIDAILFRMEQENLKQADLVPFIGSKSKVSEILSRKRALTLPMIQALHTGLGIPAHVLLQQTSTDVTVEKEVDWKRFPLKEMCLRGWIEDTYESVKINAEKILSSYFEAVGGLECVNALNKSSHTRTGREMNRYALAAWTARVMAIALNDAPEIKWKANSVTPAFMRQIAKLSVFPEGPIEAKRILRESGISLIIEQALPQTYLDGSAIMIFADHPIIGLTLRYDRIDNFWFSLLHELAHISLHFGMGINQFFDDLDIKTLDDPKESEADSHALEALIPSELWARSPARVAPSKNTILRFARQIDVHPAIVAGKVRRERNSYHMFNDLIGHGRIKFLFGISKDEEE
jgi:HTH-type transcriptional regulator / antitoxin HigA